MASDQRIGQVSSCVPWCTSTGSVIRSKYRCGEAARQIWSDLSCSPYVRAIRRLGSIELVPVVRCQRAHRCVRSPAASTQLAAGRRTPTRPRQPSRCPPRPPGGLGVGTGPYADAPQSGQRISPPTTAALHLRWQPVWSLCHHPCGEYCEEHPGDCVRDTQRGPEAEIGLRRQHTAEYQEQDSEAIVP